MSNTPRTDAATVLHSAINGPPNSGADGGSKGFEFVVTVDFAKQLERENQQLRDGLRVCKEALEHDTMWIFDNVSPVSLRAEYRQGGAMTHGPNNCTQFYALRKEALSRSAVQSLKEK